MDRSGRWLNSLVHGSLVCYTVVSLTSVVSSACRSSQSARTASCFVLSSSLKHTNYGWQSLTVRVYRISYESYGMTHTQQKSVLASRKCSRMGIPRCINETCSYRVTSEFKSSSFKLDILATSSFL